MSTLSNESAKPDSQDFSATLPINAIDEEASDQDASPGEDDTAIPPLSEVSQRLALLGKLIIPPSMP